MLNREFHQISTKRFPGKTQFSFYSSRPWRTFWGASFTTTKKYNSILSICWMHFLDSHSLGFWQSENKKKKTIFSLKINLKQRLVKRIYSIFDRSSLLNMIFSTFEITLDEDGLDPRIDWFQSRTKSVVYILTNQKIDPMTVWLTWPNHVYI